MTLSEFRATFFQKYRDHSYETQQKAYLFIWTTIWAFLIGLALTGNTIYAYYTKGDMVALRFIFANLVGTSTVVICGYFTWRGKFRSAFFILLSVITLNMLWTNILSLNRFYETGIFTNRELLYPVLAGLSLFYYRRFFIIAAILILIVINITPLLNRPDLGNPYNYYIDMALVNGTLSFIIVSVLLFFGLRIQVLSATLCMLPLSPKNTSFGVA